MNEQGGRIVSIHIVAKEGGPPAAVDEVRAVAGRGLEGDRNFRHGGSDRENPEPDREITLIESESIEALKRDHEIDLGPGQSRRNLMTRDVALNHLVGRTFRVGEVVLRGLRLCEPCSHLEGLTQKGVLGGLVHRAGLRAQIVEGGTVRVGDPVAAVAPSTADPR